MATKTRSRVASLTTRVSLMTWETVVVETFLLAQAAQGH